MLYQLVDSGLNLGQLFGLLDLVVVFGLLANSEVEVNPHVLPTEPPGGGVCANADRVLPGLVSVEGEPPFSCVSATTVQRGKSGTQERCRDSPKIPDTRRSGSADMDQEGVYKRNAEGYRQLGWHCCYLRNPST